MKKVLIFIAGVVTGAILMLVIAALIGNSSNGESSNNGMTFFEKEGAVSYTHLTLPTILLV